MNEHFNQLLTLVILPNQIRFSIIILNVLTIQDALQQRVTPEWAIVVCIIR